MEQAEIRQGIAQRIIAADTLAWTEGMAEWKPANSVPELASLFSMTPPPIPGK